MGRIPSVELSDSVVKYSLGYLRPYHREIARRLVLGEIAADICRSLHMSASRMSIIVNSPLFKRELIRQERLRDEGVADVTKTLHEIAPMALETVERTMYQAESPRLRFDAAESLLDRAGFGKSYKTDINVSGSVAHGHMTTEELKRLVLQRVERIKQEQTEKEEQEAQMNAIEVQFDNKSECPQDGQRQVVDEY